MTGRPVKPTISGPIPKKGRPFEQPLGRLDVCTSGACLTLAGLYSGTALSSTAIRALKGQSHPLTPPTK